MKKHKISYEEDIINFKKIFANLPEKIKNEDVIFVLNEKPYSWNSVFFEVRNQTDLGMKMIEKLKEIEIL